MEMSLSMIMIAIILENNLANQNDCNILQNSSASCNCILINRKLKNYLQKFAVKSVQGQVDYFNYNKFTI